MSAALALSAIGLLLAFIPLTRWLAARPARKAKRQAARASAQAGGDR